MRIDFKVYPSGHICAFVHCSFQVCISLSSKSDNPLCRLCRQLPMTTVRHTLISAGKFSCGGREHQGHMSGWCSVWIQELHGGDGHKASCLSHQNTLFWFCPFGAHLSFESFMLSWCYIYLSCLVILEYHLLCILASCSDWLGEYFTQMVVKGCHVVVFYCLRVLIVILVFSPSSSSLLAQQKEPSSDVSCPSSPRLAPPSKRTRRQTASEPSSSDTSPSPQTKGQRVSWGIPTYRTRSVAGICFTHSSLDARNGG